MKYLYNLYLKRTSRVYFMVLILFLMVNCDDNDRAVPVAADDSAPAPVTEVDVVNTPGGAILSYSLPDSKNLLYVLAVYSRKGDNTKAEKKASYYETRITLEGFADTAEREVLLYTVSRGGKRSAPTPVTIKPETPPVMKVLASLNAGPTFGGIYVNYQNPSEADLKINVITTDSLGEYYVTETNYTNFKSGVFSARGFDATERTFGLFVRDRWDNYSDTVFMTTTPYFEVQLDKTKFKELKLPGDVAHNPSFGNVLPRLWDNNLTTFFGSDPAKPFPQYFTIDLGQVTTLARMKFYPRSDGTFAYANVPRYFELWGSTNPNPDGSWDSWTKIKDCEFVKPSGSPVGVVTDDDRTYSVNGPEYDMPIDAIPVRYIRFKTLECWNGNNTAMYELTFWGSKGE